MSLLFCNKDSESLKSSPKITLRTLSSMFWSRTPKQEGNSQTETLLQRKKKGFFRTIKVGFIFFTKPIIFEKLFTQFSDVTAKSQSIVYSNVYNTLFFSSLLLFMILSLTMKVSFSIFLP